MLDDPPSPLLLYWQSVIRVQVFKLKELGAILGIKDGDKGDVCANGPKATVCLSLFAAKTFSPY